MPGPPHGHTHRPAHPLAQALPHRSSPAAQPKCTSQVGVTALSFADIFTQGLLSDLCPHEVDLQGLCFAACVFLICADVDYWAAWQGQLQGKRARAWLHLEDQGRQQGHGLLRRELCQHSCKNHLRRYQLIAWVDLTRHPSLQTSPKFSHNHHKFENYTLHSHSLATVPTAHASHAEDAAPVQFCSQYMITSPSREPHNFFSV